MDLPATLFGRPAPRQSFCVCLKPRGCVMWSPFRRNRSKSVRALSKGSGFRRFAGRRSLHEALERRNMMAVLFSTFENNDTLSTATDISTILSPYIAATTTAETSSVIGDGLFGGSTGD